MSGPDARYGARVSLELLSIARAVALAAGEKAMTMRASGVQLAGTKSTRTDIVTHADQEVEGYIRDKLSAARPDDGFFGEESGAVTGASGLTWVVDPIDGTVNYAYGIPAYGVSIAVVEGEPDPASWTALAGVVVNPAGDECFTAAAGAGAALGDRTLRLGPPPELAEALIGTGFGYHPDGRTRQAEVVARLIGRIRDIRRIGVASLDLAAVAAGRLDGYYEAGLNPWDHAAGTLIAREAGAHVGGVGGSAEGRDALICAHPRLAPALEEALLGAGFTG